MTPQEILSTYGPREAMEYDVVIVGGMTIGNEPLLDSATTPTFDCAH